MIRRRPSCFAVYRLNAKVNRSITQKFNFVLTSDRPVCRRNAAVDLTRQHYLLGQAQNYISGGPKKRPELSHGVMQQSR